MNVMLVQMPGKSESIVLARPGMSAMHEMMVAVIRKNE